MAASVQRRPLGMVMKEVDKDLALFLEMRNRENEKDNLLRAEKLNGDNDSAEINCEKTTDDNFLNHLDDKSDLDWLLAPPDTSLCLPLEVENNVSLEGRNENPNSPAIASQSSGTNTAEDLGSLTIKSMHSAESTSMKPSTAENRRPASSGGRKPTPSRPATSTGRPSLPAMTKSTRPSTPNSRATLPSTKAVAPVVRSSTPTRATARSSTPTARSSIPSNSKSTSRAATPTPTVRSSLPSTTKSKPRPATPTSTARSSVPSTSKSTSRSTTPTCKHNSILAAQSGQSSKVAKAGPTVSKNPVPSRGVSPTVKSRPSKSSEFPGLSRDAPTSTTLMGKRPSSASRGRPAATSACTSSTEASLTRKPRQQSCSPSRVRTSAVSGRSTGPALLSKSHGYGMGSDHVNPVLVGTKMVERVVNMRKLAPPKQADNLQRDNSSKKPSTSQENTGFGRSLSKKSLDMAIRHMDITRSIASDIRQAAVGTSASLTYVRTGSAKSNSVSVSDSPLATSSNASSDPSFSDNSSRPNGREIDNIDRDDDRGH